MNRISFGLVAVLVAALPGAAQAETVHVAVAANFTKVAEQLAAGFKARTGDDVVLSFGSTGALYTQISQGAPFEIFLAADDQRPARAVDEGFGVAGTVFTYAIGKLVLYGPGLDLADGNAVLSMGTFQHLAVADPAAAPYGAAAIETLTALGLYDELSSRIVTGENISQTLQFVETGNAELGFVAASQVIGKTDVWTVPADLYAPIRQDGVLLKTAEGNASALAFMDYLKSAEAVSVIEAAGYSVP